MGRYPGAVAELCEGVGQVRQGNGSPREVQRNFKMRIPVVLAEPEQGAFSDLVGDLVDQIALFSLRNEVLRGEDALLGVLPARQCLQTSDLTAVAVDLRLEVGNELTLLYRRHDLVAGDLLRLTPRPYGWSSFIMRALQQAA